MLCPDLWMHAVDRLTELGFNQVFLHMFEQIGMAVLLVLDMRLPQLLGLIACRNPPVQQQAKRPAGTPHSVPSS